MIYYSGSEWWSLMVFGRLSGSVFPRAAKFGGFSATLAFSLKWIEHEGILPITSWGLLTQSAGFSMFSATLAFVLVFRTSQCYSRFWHCASSVSTMRAQMCEAASSLVIFTNMSKKSPEEVMYFRHKIVRLMSLLHATCLASFCGPQTQFEVIDLKSFKQEDLAVLQRATGKLRVDIVYSWLNSLIIESLDSGLLNVPPPILSRVFQEMEKSMVEFHQVQQVMSIPFPFPYAQMAVVLLMTMVIGTPLIMCYWTDHPASTAGLTFIAIVCLVSLELIADELDNPFGDDLNDLPCDEFQAEINGSLALLVTPIVDQSPELQEENLRVLADLVGRGDFPCDPTSYINDPQYPGVPEKKAPATGFVIGLSATANGAVAPAAAPAAVAPATVAPAAVAPAEAPAAAPKILTSV